MKKSHSKLLKNEPVCMCKVGWCVGLGQEGDCLREGGENFLKYFKMGWNRKEGGGGQKFLKRRAETPLQTMNNFVLLKNNSFTGFTT